MKKLLSRKYGLLVAALLAVIAGSLVVRQRLSAEAVGQSALLFNYVTNRGGLDTGIAISNVSLNQFGAAQRPGPCTLFYYGTTVGGGAAPPPQTTNFILPGNQLVFTLSSGGNGLSATPSFEGYIIAFCDFPVARGVSFVSDLGLQKFFAPVPAKVIPAF
ncbi:MAG TPA: hypothetical protein VEU96_01935 [Bryobacteraceae bacterium]|nr:hypothetical protein [Bryobacteraceae bacterium]